MWIPISLAIVIFIILGICYVCFKR
jgi:hypothetical protein